MSLFQVRKLMGFFAFLAALGIAVPGSAQTTGGATGKATLLDGTPCAKCEITIARKEIHQVYKIKTNKKGKYVYIGLPIGTYKVTLFSPEGKSLYYFGEVHIGLGDPVVVDFDLPKLLANQKEEEEQKQEQAQQMQQKKMKENPEFAKQIEAEKKAQQEAAAKRAKEQKAFTNLKSFFDQGNKLYQQKDYKGAVAAFEQALPLASSQKNRVAVLGLLGDSYEKAKELPQAAETYQKLIQLDPNNATVHNNLGSVYADMNKYTEAEAEFEKAAQLNPAGASQYYFNIGAIMYNAGKMDEALASFKKVIQLDPKNAEAYFLEGQALVGKAKTGPHGSVIAPPGTVEAYETYLKLAPNGPNAATAKAILQTLKAGVQTRYKQKR